MCARASANHQFCPALSQTSSGFGFILSTSVGLSLARSQKRAPVRYSKPLSRRAVWERKTAGQKLSLEINSILHPPFRDVEATTQSDEDFLEASIQAIAVKFLTHRRRKTWAQCGVCSIRKKKRWLLILDGDSDGVLHNDCGKLFRGKLATIRH